MHCWTWLDMWRDSEPTSAYPMEAPLPADADDAPHARVAVHASSSREAVSACEGAGLSACACAGRKKCVRMARVSVCGGDGAVIVQPRLVLGGGSAFMSSLRGWDAGARVWERRVCDVHRGALLPPWCKCGATVRGG